MMRYMLLIAMWLSLISCKETKQERIIRLMHEWNNKEILFPNGLRFTVLAKDTNYFPKSEYRIITYADSIGCISCKLQLMQWKNFIMKLDSLQNVSVLFFLHPRNKEEMTYILRKDNFTYPICIDEDDIFNKSNHFPNDVMFQTFLLDKNNRVVAIGNPIHNPKVKDLYLKIVMGDKTSQKGNISLSQTTVVCNNTNTNIGKFDWHHAQNATFTLTNTGSNPLVITDVITSCGCTTVDYEKEPVRSGSIIELKVHYKADHPEQFDKTITVYCNAKTSPLKLRIKGSAE